MLENSYKVESVYIGHAMISLPGLHKSGLLT